jgi:hypothetical protein
MAKGFDCASTITISIAQSFFNDGYRFVLRYLSDSWKGLQSGETKILQDVGFQIGSLYERGGDRAGIIGANGVSNGADALRIARIHGQPLGSAIYFAVDYEAFDADMDNIEAYLRAAGSAIPGYQLGVYGSYYVIEAMKARGVCNFFFQTAAWSKGNISSHANIFQSVIDEPKFGIGIDENTSYGNEGFWFQHNAPIVSQADSDLITAGLGALYQLNVDVLAGVAVNRDDIHRVADVVRAAIGKVGVSISAADEKIINGALGALYKLSVTSLDGKVVDQPTIHRLANVIRAAAGLPQT